MLAIEENRTKKREAELVAKSVEGFKAKLIIQYRDTGRIPSDARFGDTNSIPEVMCPRQIAFLLNAGIPLFALAANSTKPH